MKLFSKKEVKYSISLFAYKGVAILKNSDDDYYRLPDPNCPSQRGCFPTQVEIKAFVNGHRCDSCGGQFTTVENYMKDDLLGWKG
jgi:hypothetical protein